MSRIEAELKYALIALAKADEVIKEGHCRFNCRTARENWIEGYRWYGRKRGCRPITTVDAEEAYRDYTKTS